MCLLLRHGWIKGSCLMDVFKVCFSKGTFNEVKKFFIYFFYSNPTKDAAEETYLDLVKIPEHIKPGNIFEI